MIEIRATRADDLPVVAKMAAELVRLHHRWDPKRFMLIEPVERGYHRFFSGQLGDGDVVLLVALWNGAIVGYLYGALEGRDWSSLLDRHGAIHDLHVAEQARKQGVASKLLEAACEKLKQLGAPRVVLMSAQANTEGQRLFEKSGFRRTMVEMTREL